MRANLAKSEPTLKSGKTEEFEQMESFVQERFPAYFRSELEATPKDAKPAVYTKQEAKSLSHTLSAVMSKMVPTPNGQRVTLDKNGLLFME